MRLTRLVSVLAAAAASCLVLALAAPAAFAQDVKAAPAPDNALVLRHIMLDMDKNTQAIKYGIEEKDWPLVAKLAALIADHPTPPLGEKIRILTYLGTDVLSFRGHDKDVEAAAATMAQAAQKEDGPHVIAAFATMQSACLACHESYRKPFLEHFYGTK